MATNDQREWSELERVNLTRLTRRGLLARAAALGLSWSVGAALLSACGGDDDDDNDAATKPAATTTSGTTGGAATPTTGGAAATTAPTQATSGSIKPGGSIA